jgi:hypothetical protein
MSIADGQAWERDHPPIEKPAEIEKPERFVIREPHEVADDEPCCDWGTSREIVERAIPKHANEEISSYVTTKGTDANGKHGCFLVDLESPQHKAWVAAQKPGDFEEIPDDPLELAALICAIAASTPDLSGQYAEVENELGVPSEIRFADSFSAHYDAWVIAFSGRLGASGDPVIDAEAHAALECDLIRERAAELCSAMAAFWAAGNPQSLFAEGGASSVGTTPVVDLAFHAFMQAHLDFAEANGVTDAPVHECYAEAEAMIRCGWEP